MDDTLNQLIDFCKEAVGIKDPKAELAYAIILLDLALIDDDFDQREQGLIYAKLKEAFGLRPEKVEELIKKAKAIVSGTGEIESFAEYIGVNFSREKREEVIGALDAVLLADEIEHPFEIDLRNRYAKILGVYEEEQDDDES